MKQSIAPESTGGMYLVLLKKILTASLHDETAWHCVNERHPRGLSLAHPFSSMGEIVIRGIVFVLNFFGVKLVTKHPLCKLVPEKGNPSPFLCYSMTSLRQLDNIQQCIESILSENVPGDLMEAGVWRGGSVILMRAVLKVHGIGDRRVWCADSFAGIPKLDKIDSLCEKGFTLKHNLRLGEASFSASLNEVQANFRRFGLLDEQVQFIEGWFKDTLSSAPIKRLALLRLDADLYQSTIDILNSLYRLVSPGGYVVVDDYYMCRGCRTAIDEFRRTAGITAELLPIDPISVYWRIS